MNLLHNAIRFCEQGGITVTSRRDGDRLRVSVRDTGEGVDAEEIPRLFREFQQVSASTRGREGGSGLGLAISKHLVELHGGEIWMESTKGVGTTVHFTVPLPGTSAAASGASKTTNVTHQTSGVPHCLVIHDSPSVARGLDRYILGYRVVGLPNALKTGDLIQQLHPRGVLTTPARRQEVAAQIEAAGFDVPLIVCGLPDQEEGSHWRGVVGYLLKPFTREAVRAMIRQIDNQGPLTIMLVDDDPDVVRLLESMLTALPHPYRFQRAYDGEQALQLMQQETPDVVFLDLVMPGLDGEHTLARMRDDERTKDVPVIIVSAQDRAGVAATVTSPLSAAWGEALDPVTAGKCLQALLDALEPSYLPAPEQLARSR